MAGICGHAVLIVGGFDFNIFGCSFFMGIIMNLIGKYAKMIEISFKRLLYIRLKQIYLKQIIITR